jgi:DNA-binding CsgD family transcriptional regulator
MPSTEPKWLPAWLYSLNLPLWITDPSGNLAFWNTQAERLFGLASSEVLGQPCHKVVAGVGATGEAFCEQHCHVRKSAQRRTGIGPFRIKVNDLDGRSHELALVVIGLAPPSRSGLWLCHLAVDSDKSSSVQEYVNRVATRSRPDAEASLRLQFEGLSPRETDILHLLSRDRSLKEIGGELGISYFTVRNHLRSIRGKLGVHSMEEVVACYLISQ